MPHTQKKESNFKLTLTGFYFTKASQKKKNRQIEMKRNKKNIVDKQNILK